mmetsp:Transcript_24934/g.44336  ORF Transcript_24934/g.44336 Transcript_24934/m.44336 type:complete len:278 (+) Transcript_24934:597-1430(+)
MSTSMRDVSRYLGASIVQIRFPRESSLNANFTLAIFLCFGSFPSGTSSGTTFILIFFLASLSGSFGFLSSIAFCLSSCFFLSSSSSSLNHLSRFSAVNASSSSPSFSSLCSRVGISLSSSSSSSSSSSAPAAASPARSLPPSFSASPLTSKPIGARAARISLSCWRARIRSDFVIFLPSSLLRNGKLPTTNSRYPLNSQQGFPDKNRLSNLLFFVRFSIDTARFSIGMKLTVRSSFFRLSQLSNPCMSLMLLRAKFRYSTSLSLRRFSILGMRLFWR